MEFDTTKFIEVLKAAGLSAREAQVAVRVAQGDEDKVIADELGLSLSAVRRYEERAREKLGAGKPR